MQPMSDKEAYSRIRSWYIAHQHQLPRPLDDYGKRSLSLILALPPTDKTNRIERKAVFGHVLTMFLEWGYNESDGVMTMSEYAKAAIGSDYALTDQEKKQLRKSRLWPYFQRSA